MRVRQRCQIRGRSTGQRVEDQCSSWVGKEALPVRGKNLGQGGHIGEACLRMEEKSLSFEWGSGQRVEGGWEVWVERGFSLSGEAQD